MTPTPPVIPEFDAAYEKLLNEAGAFDAWFAKDGGALNRSAAFTGWIARATAALAPSAKGAPSCDARELLAEFDMMWDHLIEVATSKETYFADMIVLGGRRKLFKEKIAALAAMAVSPDSANASSGHSVGASAQGVPPPLQSPNAKGD
jgi:hypothetical protein